MGLRTLYLVCDGDCVLNDFFWILDDDVLCLVLRHIFNLSINTTHGVTYHKKMIKVKHQINNPQSNV